MNNCNDFLNFLDGAEMPGYPEEKFEGFYIEIKDIVDIFYPLLNNFESGTAVPFGDFEEAYKKLRKKLRRL